MSLIADATGGAMRAVPYAPLCSRLLHGARASPDPGTGPATPADAGESAAEAEAGERRPQQRAAGARADPTLARLVQSLRRIEAARKQRTAPG